MLSKIYFWLYVALTVFVILFEDFWKPIDILFEVTNIFVLFAAYGFLYRKPLFYGAYLKPVIILFTIFWLLYIFVFDNLYGGYPPVDALDYVLGILAPLPIYVWAWKYLKLDMKELRKTDQKRLIKRFEHLENWMYALIFLFLISVFIITQIIS